MKENLPKGFLSVAAISVLAATALAGCGGSSGSDSATQGASSSAAAATQEAGANDASRSNGSKPPWDRPHGPGVSPGSDRFIAQADAICRRGKLQGFHAMTAYLQKTERSSKPEAVRIAAALKAGVVPSIERQVKEIRALEPPRGEGWQVRAFLVALGEGIYSEHKNSRYLHFNENFAHSAEIARALGVKGCIYQGKGLE